MIQTNHDMSIDVCVDRLEQVLREATKLNAQLVQCIRSQQAALSSADTKSLAQLLAQERDLINAIDGLEQRRQVVTATMATKLGLTSDGPIGLAELVSGLEDETVAGRLLEAGLALRTGLEEARKEGGVLQSSCVALLGHVGGLMQSIRVGMSQTKTYGRDGRVGHHARVSERLDVRS